MLPPLSIFKITGFVDLGALIMLSPKGKPQKIECGSYIAHFARWSQINLASKQINIVRKNISRKKGLLYIKEHNIEVENVIK